MPFYQAFSTHNPLSKIDTEIPEETIKTIGKGLIFLKASVVAMGIIFAVLLITLIFVKKNKNQQEKNNCPQYSILEITNGIAKMELQGSNNIIILTNKDPKTGSQKIIKIDSHCYDIINSLEILSKNP